MLTLPRLRSYAARADGDPGRGVCQRADAARGPKRRPTPSRRCQPEHRPRRDGSTERGGRLGSTESEQCPSAIAALKGCGGRWRWRTGRGANERQLRVSTSADRRAAALACPVFGLCFSPVPRTGRGTPAVGSTLSRPVRYPSMLSPMKNTMLGGAARARPGGASLRAGPAMPMRRGSGAERARCRSPAIGGRRAVPKVRPSPADRRTTACHRA